MDKYFAVYIMASARNGTLYTGITSNLPKRVWEHREGVVDGFTKAYAVKHLVWYEVTEDPLSAIAREKQIKAWKRGWKLKLIEKKNPDWRDLFEEVCQ
jgi:putative endonuclease